MIDCITHSMEYGEKSARHHTATQQPQRLCGKEDKTILILAPKTGNYQILARIEPYSIIRNPRSHSVVLVLDKSAEDGVVDCTPFLVNRAATAPAVRFTLSQTGN